MALEIYCTKCLKFFSINKKAKDRRELLEEIGEYFHIRCKKCGYEREYHVNDVKARSSFNINILGTLVGLVILVCMTVFFWNQGVITNVGIILGAVIILASNRSMMTSNEVAFNKYKIQSSPRNVKD